ncbi:MAG: hypothetical protein OXU27_11630 [Candidatus Poribacteria bacterium]|nr:hypothetical protein [Candidatus Poribacteria bacterium]
MFKSKLFWGGVLLCVVVLFGVLVHRANQPQETIKIYKIAVPAKRAKTQSADEQKAQTNQDIDKTQIVSTPTDSDVSIDSGDFTSEDTQFFEAEVQTEENTLSVDVETETDTTPEEERFFGLTLAEIEEKIPVLEEEIHTNLTKAVELYTELRSTDGMAGKSPEIAAWRDETWQEVKRLFNDVAHTGKILRYRSFLRVTGVEGDPILPGGWIYELMEPLPMRVEPGEASP